MNSRLLQRTICLLLGMAFLAGPEFSFVPIERQADLFHSRSPLHITGKHFHASHLVAKRIAAPTDRLIDRRHQPRRGRTVVRSAPGHRPRSAPLFQAGPPLSSVRLRC